MKLRTITFWVVYNPNQRVIVESARFKKNLRSSIWPPRVAVKMTGHYLRARARGKQ